MSKDNLNINDSKIKKWNEHAKSYDKWYERFEGAVEHFVDWHLLKTYLPSDKKTKILDAAGGTGRITIPLAKLGYSVTLCDISSGMLNVAKKKIQKEGLSKTIEVTECDVCNLPFPNENFDFVLCWGEMTDAVMELIRVLRKGGIISVFLTNRFREAINMFSKNPLDALALTESHSDYTYHGKERHKVISLNEAINLFKEEGIKILETYAVCGWMNILRIPEKILESKKWNKTYFNQVTKMVLKLSKEPSIKGISRHIALYGEKI